MVLAVDFEVDGQRFTGINGGPQFRFDEAVSFQIRCDTQDEVDYYWERLCEGGQEWQCGWLNDSYGLSWQVTPNGMDELLADPDPQRASRVMQAMLGMRKLDTPSCVARPTAPRPPEPAASPPAMAVAKLRRHARRVRKLATPTVQSPRRVPTGPS
jgi:hypothetical protein